MKVTQCEIGKIGLIEKNILLVDINNESEIEIEHVHQFRNVAAQLAKTTKIYSIINSGEFSLPTREAREHYVQHGVDSHILGRAFVVHDLGQMILARHIIKQKKSKVPTEIFMDFDKAEKWVKDLRAKNHDLQPIASH